MRDKLLLKSFKKPYKYHIILFLVIFISVIFTNTVTLFYEALLDMKYNNTKYGTYHGVLYNMDSDKIDKLSEERSVDRVIGFERNVFNSTDGTGLYLDAVPKDYFDFTEYYLTSGSFPKNHSEICCESSFLFMRGISQENFLGSKIQLGNEEYTVTGTFKSHRLWSTMPNYYVQCFTSSPVKMNSAAFSLKNIDRCDAVVSKYEKNSVYCEYNMNQWAIELNSYQNRKLYVPLLVVLLAVMTSIFIHIVSMMLMHHNINIGVSGFIGINKNSIRKCIFINVLKTILLSGTFGILCSFISVGAVKEIYKYTYSSDVTSFVYKRGFLIVLFLTFILILLYTVSLLFIIILKTRKLNIQDVRNEKSINVRKRVSINRITNYIIAKRHIKNAKLSNILTFITISFLICLIPVFKLYFSSVIQDVKKYEGYDYVAELDEDKFRSYNNRIVNNYVRKIAAPYIDGCVSVPIYSKSCNLKVYKDTISDEYAELLKKDYQYELSNNYSDTMQIPFIMVGITDEQQKQLNIDLKKYEAIAYRNIINNSNNIVGVKLENYSKIQLDEENSLEIIGVKNEYDDILPSSQVANVLMINMETYIELFGNDPIPSRIFYKVSKESINELTALFSGKNFVKLTDISQIEGNNRHLKICNYINIFLIMLTFFFLLINSCITAYISIQRNIKEYSIMSAIGISKYNISLMVIYQSCGVILSSLIVSDVLALIITNLYYNELMLLSRIQIPMPYMEIVISNIIVIFACVLICKVFLYHFWNIASNKRLRNM